MHMPTWNDYGKNLAIKLVVALSYNLIQYFFIGGEFLEIHHWITSSSYISYTCKISRKLKINNYVIKLFIYLFKLCIKYKLIDHMVIIFN